MRFYCPAHIHRESTWLHMLPLWTVFLSFLSFQTLCSALATLAPATRAVTSTSDFFSIPISKTNVQTVSRKMLHGSVVQQQHINHGLRRLALMTSRTPPSRDTLLSALFNRLSHLPKNVLRKYQLEDVKKAIDIYLSSHPREREETPNAPGHNVGLTVEPHDFGYLATAQMGNPPRDFQLLIDSGSADLWVGGEGCRNMDGGDCGAHKLLGPTSSTTFKATRRKWSIGYPSGSVSGLLARDEISIQDLHLKNHTFGVALNESREISSNNTLFDGILGLAKSDISQQGVPSFLQSLYQANLIHARIVSYRIPRTADGKNSGVMTIGGMDGRLFDPQTLVRRRNINKLGFWSVAVGGIMVGMNNMQWSNRTIVLDTGTALIIAPKNDVDAIHHLIPGARNDGAGWKVPCNMTTSIALTIGGQPFSIDPRDVAFIPVDEEPGYCMSGIAVGGVWPFYLDNEWLAGDVFLKNVYFSTDEDRDEVVIAKPI